MVGWRSLAIANSHLMLSAQLVLNAHTLDFTLFSFYDHSRDLLICYSKLIALANYCCNQQAKLWILVVLRMQSERLHDLVRDQAFVLGIPTNLFSI
jgi:hypothetical protein